MFEAKSNLEQDANPAKAVKEPPRFSPIFVISVCTVPDAANAAPQGLWMAMFDYEGNAEDELSLCRGNLVEVLAEEAQFTQFHPILNKP